MPTSTASTGASRRHLAPRPATSAVHPRKSPRRRDKNRTTTLEAKEGLDEDRVTFLQCVEMYREASELAVRVRDKDNSVRALNLMIQLALPVPDFFVLKKAYKLLALMFVLFKDWKNATTSLERLRDVADEESDFETIMYAYQHLGNLFQHLREYDKAIIAFKKLLQFAWLQNSMEKEMTAYEMLGIQYYYKSLLDKSFYYHDRAIRGKREARGSYARTVSEENFRKKQDIKISRYNAVVVKETMDYTKGVRVVVKEEFQDYEQLRDLYTEVPKRALELKKITLETGARTPSEKQVSPQRATTNAYYTEDDQHRKKVIIREGTPINEMSTKDLPSPSCNSRGRNVYLLPYP